MVCSTLQFGPHLQEAKQINQNELIMFGLALISFNRTGLVFGFIQMKKLFYTE